MSDARYVYFEYLVREDTPKTMTILVKVDQVADASSLDDQLLDTLMARTGL